MKIGIDLHNTIDKNPEGFKELAKSVLDDGGEVYIITGASKKDALIDLKKLNFNLYTKIFSITDNLLSQNRTYHLDIHGRPCFDDVVWYGAKGLIAYQLQLDVHYDDTFEFSKYFIGKTTFILYKGE